MEESKIKNFSKELSTIEKIESYKNKKVILENCKGKAYITKSIKDFKLYFEGVFNYASENQLKVEIDSEKFMLKSNDFKHALNDSLAKLPALHTFDINNLNKGNIDNVSLFRMFFFDDSKRENVFHTKLETAKHNEVNTWAFGCVRLTVNKYNYDITQYKDKDKSYFVIENLEPISLDEFEKDSYAIQKGIGFLIGYMPGGENYIFSGENFIYRRLSRKSLKSLFHPVTSNPYSKLYNEKDIADIYYGKLKVIPSSVISELISQLRNNEEFSVTIIFLMEVTSLKSVVSMPGVFSVILESLANSIIIKEDKLEKLLTDKKLIKELSEDLNTVIDKYTSKIKFDAEVKIRRRINDFNKPINHKRLTNAEKLRAPFDQLKIKLSEEDEKAIDYRNDLLHGNILMNNEIERTSEEIDNQMLYISAKFYTLISKLILKKCGYNGYVINHAKLYKSYSKEDYFDEI